MKWRLALRIATSPSERWLMKAAEWNPELSQNTGPTERLGDQEKAGKMTYINEFLKLVEDEIENFY